MDQFGDPRTAQIKDESQGLKCCFCRREKINEMEWGPLLQLDDIVTHHFCLLFASGLSQTGDDNEGILGFMPQDIRAEIKRGSRLRCKFCKKTSATIGCVKGICGHSFHYPCGYENGCLSQFFGSFSSYCRSHKPRQEIPDGICHDCPICMMNTSDEDGILPPCCKNGLFHRACIMKSAIVAGYFFKCPLCNSADPQFMQTMKENGVYIPEQDAAWEIEPNAFEDLLIAPRCDVTECICQRGREYTTKGHSKLWDIIRCGDCGAVGTHMKCSNLSVREWKCDDCLTLSKRPNSN